MDAVGVEVMLWLAAALAFVVSAGSGDGALDPVFTRLAGYPVRVWNRHGLTNLMGSYGLPGPAEFPYGWALYEVRGGKPVINLGRPIARNLHALRTGSWKRGDYNQLRNAAISLFALGREIGHARFNDVMHGQPGHNDVRANRIAWRRMNQYGRKFGLTLADVRVLRDMLRTIGKPPQIF